MRKCKYIIHRKLGAEFQYAYCLYALPKYGNSTQWNTSFLLPTTTILWWIQIILFKDMYKKACFFYDVTCTNFMHFIYHLFSQHMAVADLIVGGTSFSMCLAILEQILAMQINNVLFSEIWLQKWFLTFCLYLVHLVIIYKGINKLPGHFFFPQLCWSPCQLQITFSWFLFRS